VNEMRTHPNNPTIGCGICRFVFCWETDDVFGCVEENEWRELIGNEWCEVWEVDCEDVGEKEIEVSKLMDGSVIGEPIGENNLRVSFKKRNGWQSNLRSNSYVS
jgi:hypothetical protein